MVNLILVAAAAGLIWTATRSVRNLSNLDVRFRTATDIRIQWNQITAKIRLDLVNPSLQEFMLSRVVGQIKLRGSSVGYFDVSPNQRIAPGSNQIDVPVAVYPAELLKHLGSLSQLASAELQLVGEWQSGSSKLPLQVSINLPVLA